MVEKSSPSDDLVASVEGLKVGLLQAVTSGAVDLTDDEYRRVRKLLISNPRTTRRIPEWLRQGSTLWEVVGLLRKAVGDEAGKWERRRQLVQAGLAPVLAELEGSDAEMAEQFELMERIGGGGFGEVFKYRHRLLDLPFAVKMLAPSFPEEKDRSLERFFLEARILFRLNHPNIVRVYDVGLLSSKPFIRMEFIDGITLNEQLMRQGLSGPPFEAQSKCQFSVVEFQE